MVFTLVRADVKFPILLPPLVVPLQETGGELRGGRNGPDGHEERQRRSERRSLMGACFPPRRERLRERERILYLLVLNSYLGSWSLEVS